MSKTRLCRMPNEKVMLMRNITYDELDQLLLEGNNARIYAWEHYEDLSARTSEHKLYGPYCPGLGAGIPGSLTSAKNRELKKQTRRKNYHIYELNSDYKLIRMISIVDYTNVEMIYHCFEYNGTQYAIPFRGERKELSNCQNVVIRYRDGLPAYLGFASKAYLLAHFYECCSNSKVLVTCYAYSREARQSVYGLPVDWNALPGEPASPVEIATWEENVRYTDFSQWFK